MATHFNSFEMSSVSDFLSGKFTGFVQVFLYSVSVYIFPLLGFIKTLVFRLIWNGGYWEKFYEDSVVIFEPNSEKDSEFDNLKEEEIEIEEEIYFADDDDDGISEKDSEFDNLKEEELENKEEIYFADDDDDDDGISEKEPEFCFQFKFPTYEELNKREFGKNIGFIDEPEFSKTVFEEENRDESNDLVNNDGPLSNNDFFKFMIEDVHVEIDNLINSTVCEEEESKLKEEDNFSEKSNKLDLEENLESDADTSSSNHSHEDGFLSDGDFGGEFEQEEDQSSVESSDSDELVDEESNADEVEFKVIEEAELFLSEKDFEKPNEKTREFEKSRKVEFSFQDSEETNKLESLWEHQELIEQLKMELKKVRATGLPTILEESESPKITEDLKPWKIDEKMHQENPMGEFQKFYKSYRDKMRKLDILNYQKMYAIGFLQLKDPIQPTLSTKSSIPEIATFLSQNLDQNKNKKKQSESTMKFLKELQSDLEVVYVGQMCLSWEILHWQYIKALDLWESDPRGIRLFNEVAGEFQQFNIFMQRFIEEERFQGPRVQNYIKNRCILRNILQVPLIREDNLKDKRKARFRDNGEYGITSDILVEVIEESIRIFWQFVRADKDCINSSGKGKFGKSLHFQEPADSTIFLEVHKDLLKKDRRIKDILRSGNCILRKFKKCKEGNNDYDNQVLYFFCQVDIKLVSRVLNMSRLTTDQLTWCRNKLRKIVLVDREINVDPTFLLFPC